MHGLRRSKRLRLTYGPDKSKSASMTMNQEDTSDDTLTLSPLHIPLILTEIFKNLNTEELLNCSLVSKTWNKEARTVLRDYKHCCVYVDRDGPCEGLKQLELQLRMMTVIPYNALQLKIEWGHTSSRSCLGSRDIQNFYSCITKNVQWKKLYINWSGTRGRKKCPAVHLIKLLLERSEHLVELSISEAPGGEQLSKSIQETNQNEIRFPRLKRLKTNYFPVFEEQPSPILSLFCYLLSAAPNLEELWGEVRPVHLEFLPQRALEVIKELRFFPRSPINPAGYDRLAVAKPQLRSLEALDCDVDNFDGFEDTNWDSWRRLKPILESSTKSLENFYTDTVVAAVQVRCGMPRLEKVSKIQFELDPQVTDQASLRRMLRKFFSSFPQLSSVSIIMQDILFDGQVQQFINWCNDADMALGLGEEGISLPACGKLDKLVTSGVSEDIATCLVEIFPDIVSLTVESYEVRSAPLSKLWSLWPNLERLSISSICFSDIYGFMPGPPPLHNFDAIFCGIHPEEAAFLQRKSIEYLKAVHIVPIKPAITDLKNLRELRIRLTGHPAYVDRIKPSQIFVTKVTCLLAFRRMSKLLVTLDCGSAVLHQRLKRLEPYVNLLG